MPKKSPRSDEKRDTIQLPRTEEEKQLEKECRALKKTLKRECFLLENFQTQKTLRERYWQLGKRNQESSKMELRGKFRQKEDLEDRQRYELRLYQEKVKHLLHEEQANTTEVRLATEAALNGQQDSHRTELQRIHAEARSLLVKSKEMSSKFQEVQLELKKDHEQRIMSIREEKLGSTENLRLDTENKMRTTRNAADDKRKSDIQLLERKLGDHISVAMHQHQEEFAEIKHYYSDITHANLDLIKSLKGEVQELQKTCKVREQALSEVISVNRKLSEPFKGYVNEVQQLKTQLENHAKDKDSLKITQDKIETITSNVEQLIWENEIRDQKKDKLQEELSILRSKRDVDVERVLSQQTLHNLALERQVNLAEERMQKTELAWQELCHSMGRDSIASSRRDSLLQKERTIKTLEKKLEDSTSQYYKTIHTFEDLQLRHLGYIAVNIEHKTI